MGGEAGLWASELLLRERRTTDFTRGGNKRAGGRKKERERGEIRGRFCVFVSGGKGPVARGSKGSSPRCKGSPSPAFLLRLLMTGGGGIIVPFRRRLNYLLLVCVVTVHSGGDYSIPSPPPPICALVAARGMYRHANALCASHSALAIQRYSAEGRKKKGKKKCIGGEREGATF